MDIVRGRSLFAILQICHGKIKLSKINIFFWVTKKTGTFIDHKYLSFVRDHLVSQWHRVFKFMTRESAWNDLYSLQTCFLHLTQFFYHTCHIIWKVWIVGMNVSRAERHALWHPTQQKWSFELSYTVYFLRESLCDIVVGRSSHKFLMSGMTQACACHTHLQV